MKHSLKNLSLVVAMSFFATNNAVEKNNTQKKQNAYEHLSQRCIDDPGFALEQKKRCNLHQLHAAIISGKAQSAKFLVINGAPLHEKTTFFVEEKKKKMAGEMQLDLRRLTSEQKKLIQEKINSLIIPKTPLELAATYGCRFSDFNSLQTIIGLMAPLINKQESAHALALFLQKYLQVSNDKNSEEIKNLFVSAKL